MTGSRNVRTRPRNGLAITDLLTSTLLSELCCPSDELWIVSGWITDIPILENKHRQYDAVLESVARSSLSLTEVLAELAARGAHLHVALRSVDHNTRFRNRLQDRVRPDRLSLYESADVHEKIMVGNDWVMKGSMNFTWNGVQQNEESIDFSVGKAAASFERLELRTRWIEAG
ncbi:phospholipase D-like domain-containing protein DpdK [Kribbella catacumbae]|uniref:phospholipase D-like domain-containing protein DpdK n=1 Tax=Kribbella catacumbae TaxID=460086 RepID=UPI000375CED2|nr:phospholipase D-like domain-containing protein DpdK [Kribbella catacumbae]